jgi:carbohydrate binding protein with CBM6 domain
MILRKAIVAAGWTCVCVAITSLPAAAATTAAPFGGTAVILPGTIEAENFDDGGASVAYFDTTAGNRGGAYRQTDVDIEATSDAGGGWNIGWTRAGEWLQYTASVTASGTYSLELRVASLSTGGIVRLEVDGADVTGPLAVPNTGGWQTWTTIRKDGIVLAAGIRRLRLVFVTAGTDGIGNINFLRIVPSATVPSPWTSTDVGQPSPAGAATYGSSAFTVKGGGADIWGTGDSFQYVSQPAPGDSQIVVRVTSMGNTNPSAKAAVMMRESMAADAANVMLDVEPNGSIEFMTRRATGDITNYLAGASVSFPAWLKLSRTGTTLIGSISNDGVTWRPVGSTDATATLGLVGIAVNSHSSTLNTSVFDNVTVGAPPVVLPPAPSAPSMVAPSLGATAVAVNTPLSWTANGATSYDVRFGTTNPPAAAATGLAAPSYTPAALANNTTYYWQVVAQNAGGSTAGPVWSFTTIVAPPSTPTLLAPADKTTAVANPSLSWSASGATAYDVRLATTNPPASAATGLTASTYAPTALAAGTMYYWQVVARNAGGAAEGPVWSFTTAGVPSPWTSRDVGAVVLAGSANYANGTFTVAGGGADIWGTADAFQFVSQPVTGDTQIVARVVSVQNTQAKAKAGIMLRESTAPDAAHVILSVKPAGAGVEFMTRATTGAVTVKQSNTLLAAPVYVRLTRIGSTVTGDVSTDGVAWTTVGTATASTAWPLAGLIVNSHDTTVLNTATFDNVAVAVPPPPPPPPPPTTTPTPTGVSPTVYRAITDRNPYAKPTLPVLGPAGYTFNDPTFGSKIARVTDGNTRPGLLNRSFRVPSNAHLAAWNASSTLFFVLSNDGTVIPYSFDQTTMTASRIRASGSGDGGLTLAFYVEAQFSLVNPNVIYGAASGGNGRTISQYDFGTGTYSPLIDLDSIVSGLQGTYVGAVMSGGTTDEKLVTFFGGGSQDRHFYLMWSPVGNPAARKILDTHASTINGVATSVTLNFNIHAAAVDKSGRFVFVYPTGVDLNAPRNAAPVYLWDTQNDSIVELTNGRNGTLDVHPGGHDAAGYGYSINQDCCTSSSWDAMQWEFRNLTNPLHPGDLISPVLSPKEIYAADHTTWNNARADALVPVISSTYRLPADTTAWRAWDDEIIGVDTTGGVGGLVYRFAHHRSDIRSDTDPSQAYFWYEPIANVSPDGQFVLFTSNWEKTLGRDAAEGTARQDVFVVRLTPQ